MKSRSGRAWWAAGRSDAEKAQDMAMRTKHLIDLKIKSDFEAYRNMENFLALAAIQLCREFSVDYYVKADLAKYLDGIPFYNVDKRKIKRAPQNA